MDEILADLPPVPSLKFPFLSLFAIHPLIYISIAVIPLLMTANEVLMGLLTTLALHFPRLILSLSIFLLWTVAIVLISLAHGIHEYTVKIDSSLSELLLKWVFIAGFVSLMCL